MVPRRMSPNVQPAGTGRVTAASVRVSRAVTRSAVGCHAAACSPSLTGPLANGPASGPRSRAVATGAVVTRRTVARTAARAVVPMPVGLVTHNANDSGPPVLCETARAVRIAR